ncbi:hypothetical protein MATL_G00010400 [Megalops atlanticus]|uniref:Uncharacterized protein n=1 Tax=Megalops atlanticus TaxID=7932 RepID=A0A9D3QH87_MEGAT|nr:hypothetical protein MATL_G00010400 [Megalops atlanticus]
MQGPWDSRETAAQHSACGAEAVLACLHHHTAGTITSVNLCADFNRGQPSEPSKRNAAKQECERAHGRRQLQQPARARGMDLSARWINPRLPSVPKSEEEG